MDDNFWRNLIEASLATTEDEINCLDCFELLDEYVDLLDSGKNPAEVLPQLEQHLKVCSCCQTEVEAVLTAVRAAMSDESQLRPNI